jgi:hypothetical protein
LGQFFESLYIASLVGDPILDPPWVLSCQLVGEEGVSFLAGLGQAVGLIANMALALRWVMFAMALGDKRGKGDMLAG